jgi:cell fate (sporulation/competence/biofilm development) regulator YlbF (YheA/YmcA/DUF963 family)
MTEQTPITRRKILDMARELGMALAESKELLEYRTAEKRMAEDAEACRLARAFKEAHLAMVRLQEDHEASEEERNQAKDLLEKADRDMKAHPLTAEYYRAGNAFNTLIYHINQIFKFYCLEPGEDSQFEQRHGCGRCGGNCPE